jgi:hypothetical protein
LQEQALRINKLARSTTPQSVFFWSDVYGDEGLFYADFGDEFSYKEDQKTGSSNTNTSSNSSSSAAEAAKEAQKAIKTLNFPALETVLGRKWSEVTSRHFPLSKTFVKHRLLCAFR